MDLCSCFDEKPAEITNSCKVPGHPAVKLSSTNFRQIFPAVQYLENDPFSQPRD